MNRHFLRSPKNGKMLCYSSLVGVENLMDWKKARTVLWSQKMQLSYIGSVVVQAVLPGHIGVNEFNPPACARCAIRNLGCMLIKTTLC